MVDRGGDAGALARGGRPHCIDHAPPRNMPRPEELLIMHPHECAHTPHTHARTPPSRVLTPLRGARGSYGEAMGLARACWQCTAPGCTPPVDGVRACVVCGGCRPWNRSLCDRSLAAGVRLLHTPHSRVDGYPNDGIRPGKIIAVQESHGRGVRFVESPQAAAAILRRLQCTCIRRCTHQSAATGTGCDAPHQGRPTGVVRDQPLRAVGGCWWSCCRRCG